jgi:glycosyltransferase involved in cell wall biosynthesis
LGIASAVRFAGYVPPSDALSYYDLAWTLVLPSITTPAGRETWGLVANEAFNRRLPMVATTAVGAAAGGLVVHNRNGLVVPERDPHALAAALGRMLAEPGLRDRLAQAAFHDVSEWTHERMALGFRDAIHFVLRDGRAPESK